MTWSPVNRYYATRMAHKEQRAGLWRVLTEYLQRDVSPDARILELGAGYCDFINSVRAAERHALDLAETLPLYAASDVTTHIQSCTDLSGFSDGYFDVVFASNLFEHLTRKELDSTMSEVHRLLRSNGTLIIIQPNFRYCYREYFDDYTHKTVFTHVSLCDLLKAHGFAIRTVIRKFLPFSLRSRIPKPTWLLRLYLRSPFRPFAGQMYVVAQADKSPGR